MKLSIELSLIMKERLPTIFYTIFNFHSEQLFYTTNIWIFVMMFYQKDKRLAFLAMLIDNLDIYFANFFKILFR